MIILFMVIYSIYLIYDIYKYKSLKISTILKTMIITTNIILIFKGLSFDEFEALVITFLTALQLLTLFIDLVNSGK